MSSRQKTHNEKRSLSKSNAASIAKHSAAVKVENGEDDEEGVDERTQTMESPQRPRRQSPRRISTEDRSPRRRNAAKVRKDYSKSKESTNGRKRKVDPDKKEESDNKYDTVETKEEGEFSSGASDYREPDVKKRGHSRASRSGSTAKIKKEETASSNQRGKTSNRGQKRKVAPGNIKHESSDKESTGESDNNLQGDEQESSSDESFHVEKTRKSRGRPAQKKKNQQNTSSGCDVAPSCPHCNKTLRSTLALNYHIENFVCRPELKPGGGTNKRGGAKGKKRKAENSSTEKVQKRFCAKLSEELGGDNGNKSEAEKPSTEKVQKRNRGKLADRTCPKCKRVFTSVLGKDYHCTNRVCEQNGAKVSSEVAFATLPPGKHFVTTFGVVEVVNDSRAAPTVQHLKTAAGSIKKWKASRGKLEAKRKENYLAVAVHGLARRKRLNKLYEEKEPTQEDIWEVYRGFPRVAPYPIYSRHPLEPDGCHPDRIVECKLVPNIRKRFLCRGKESGDSHEVDVTEEQVPLVNTGSCGQTVRLFLRRRDLTEQCISGGSYYCCQDCGKNFSSIVGAKYHCKAKSCVKQAKERKEEALGRLEDINTRAARLIVRQNWTKTARKQVATRTKPKSKPMYFKQLPKCERDAFYPQVWHALGFKIVPRISRTAPRVSYFGRDKRKSAPKPRNPNTLYLDSIEDASVLDSGIDKLKNELTELRSAELGAMYPEVYKILRFRKPKPLSDNQRHEPPPDPPEPTPFRPKPPPSQFQPTIIDVQVLAGEVDAGRYPSMKRGSNKAEEHEDACYICKEAQGELCLCDFCKRVNHLECIRTRFIIKDPEPHDDFMCNKCIQYLLAMRKRAERRRLERHGTSREDQQETNVAQAPTQVRNYNVEPGKEFEHLGKQAQTVDDIMHLLKDSQSRLKQLMETTKMNDFRRRQMIDG